MHIDLSPTADPRTAVDNYTDATVALLDRLAAAVTGPAAAMLNRPDIVRFIDENSLATWQAARPDSAWVWDITTNTPDIADAIPVPYPCTEIDADIAIDKYTLAASYPEGPDA